MFYYLKGELTVRDINTCVIECGGVGYKLTVSILTSESLAAKLGTTVNLYTYLAVREDGVELFGFNSLEEKNTFDLLLGVSGVGPKAAISILSVLSADRLAMAICTDDTKSIAKAPGVGAKTAARIILELKDKVAKQMLPRGANTVTLGSVGAVAHASSGVIGEATQALMVLGYDKNSILNVLGSINTSGLDTASVVRAALKKLAGGI